MAAMVSGVSFAVSVPGRAFDSTWDSCVSVAVGRAALQPCRIPSWRVSARPNFRCWEVRSSRNGAASKKLSVDNDNVAVLVTRNALQVSSVGNETAGTPALVSECEGLLMKKGEEVAQELAQKSLEGTSIFLIGMMACGKSTVGRIVANALNYEFSDSDDVIESYLDGLLVKEIFRQRSEVEFRDLETRALQQLAEVKRLVVATGGGAVVRDDNWAYLRGGITVWLDVPVIDLAKRVTAVGTESRPLLGGKCGTYEEALAKLSELMDEREPYYSRAQCRLSLQDLASSLQLPDVGALTPTVIAVQVLEEIKQALEQKYFHSPTGY